MEKKLSVVVMSGGSGTSLYNEKTLEKKNNKKIKKKIKYIYGKKPICCYNVRRGWD